MVLIKLLKLLLQEARQIFYFVIVKRIAHIWGVDVRLGINSKGLPLCSFYRLIFAKQSV
jgi:hypothetical protein